MKSKTTIRALLFSICIMIVFPNFAQDISTKGEIYDFEIGDIFHFEKFGSYGWGQSGYWRKINDSIADKYFSAGNDTVFYTVSRNTAEISEWNQYWTYDTTTFLLTIAPVNSLIFNGNIDSVYSNPNLFNGRIVNYTEYYQGFDSILYKKEWVEGCGLTWDIYIDSEWGNDEELILNYYKKGDEEWGMPVIIVSLDEKSTNNLAIYPNPADNELSIDLRSTSEIFYFYEIYSIEGKLVKTNLLEISRLNRINIETIERGLYIINIISEDKIYQSKFVKR